MAVPAADVNGVQDRAGVEGREDGVRHHRARAHRGIERFGELGVRAGGR